MTRRPLLEFNRTTHRNKPPYCIHFTNYGFSLVILTILGAIPVSATGTGFTDHGEDLQVSPPSLIEVDGNFRLRGESNYNFDLDRGLTPSGLPLYPVPLSDPSSQWLHSADMRLRTDMRLYSPFGGVAVKMRIDLIDNLVLGGSPDGWPGATTTQQDPAESVLHIKRAYAEVLTPFGLLAGGRMGSHWGLGMLTNGGDCPDCNSGDAADRVAFIIPTLGHLWAVAYDFSSVGPIVPRRDNQRLLNVDPADDVHTFTFAVLSVRDDIARNRRRLAGKTTIEYGAYLSYRFQEKDVPASYLPAASSNPLTASQIMSRDLSAWAADIHGRFTAPGVRIEAEFAVVFANIEQSSLIPGALLYDSIESLQFGGVVESEFGDPNDLVFGVDFGIASGDPDPGFGAFPGGTDAIAPKPGDLDGPQAVLPRDRHVHNFRFHPDYHIDRILFREIIGTVTDAAYFRPHVRWRAIASAAGSLDLSLFGVAAWALYAESTPGTAHGLGVELDPGIRYHTRDGWDVNLEYAILFPLDGLDNPVEKLDARVAQSARLRFAVSF
ncbi:MAG: TIGR04551 family protein [Myxococcales bacterium]|nr:TIGR04551 family protein [Myxococcales bacterium]